MKYTYISLFSSAGIGCYGFQKEGFDCILTNELLEKRINIQKINKKCKDAKGYICGDITDFKVQNYIIQYTNEYKKKNKLNDIDVVIATPPCQGMSVVNHKKTDNEIIRNSLVLEAINLISRIKPKIFLFENVALFMTTKCGKNEENRQIGQAIKEELDEFYKFEYQIINFKDYGANSSRKRCIVIGVRRDIQINITDLWPSKENPKRIRDLIYHLPRLKKMGEISKSDIYHGFKKYKENMREWIKDLKPGENAFDNLDPNKRPHQIKKGILVPNINKNGDKYCRQVWDKTPPCIHTRNDILASQNTIHPEDDRVFSIRELMIFMNVPLSFKWAEKKMDDLNALSEEEKIIFLKQNEINIRTSLGEAVPTIIFSKIAKNIKKVFNNFEKK